MKKYPLKYSHLKNTGKPQLKPTSLHISPNSLFNKYIKK